MGRLTTHVLDTANGRPGAGITVDLSVLRNGEWKLLKSVRTNADGRTDAPLLEADKFRPGAYELAFHLGSYFRAQGFTSLSRAEFERMAELMVATGRNSAFPASSRCACTPRATP